MNRLELHVRQLGPHQHRPAVVFGVQKVLERLHAVGHGGVCRRHECGIAGTGAAEPVLRAAELARVLAAAPPARQQDTVNLAEQPVRQREPLPQARQPVLESSDVVGNLDHVVERDAGGFVELEEQEVRQRRLRPFDLGGKHRLLAHVGIEKEGVARAVLLFSKSY